MIFSVIIKPQYNVKTDKKNGKVLILLKTC